MSVSNRVLQGLLIVLIAGNLLCPATGLASETPADEARMTGRDPGEAYRPSGDAVADVARAIAAARENGRLVLVVLGANWCHDSRALAARLHEEPLAAIIDRSYQVVFVDVAYLENGRDVISSIGPPVYYATPTVLILDPVSGLLVNAENRHQWAHAHSIDMAESVEYFQLMANTDLSALREGETPTAERVELLAEIDAFEREQAERLYAAYAVIGPMLKAYENGQEPALFQSYWNELRQFRMQVPADIDGLRHTATQRLSAGETGVRLEYPEYPPFSWEAPRR